MGVVRGSLTLCPLSGDGHELYCGRGEEKPSDVSYCFDVPIFITFIIEQMVFDRTKGIELYVSGHISHDQLSCSTQDTLIYHQ